MKFRCPAWFALALLAFTLPAAVLAQVSPDGPALSPFRAMRRVEAGIEVQVLDDKWYELESVAGVDAATLQKEARRLCGGADWKRITEDLPALLDAMGHRVGTKVDVGVRDLATGERKLLEQVEMTGENRRRLWQANNRAPRALPVIGDLFAAKLSAEHVAGDLAALRRLLDTRFAYRELRPVDLDALLAEARARLGDGPVARAALVREVDRVLRRFGDGHSRLRESLAAGPWAPFLIQQVDGGLVAFRADRSGFVDPERPFVVAIDGVPLARWLAAARDSVTHGSAVMQARDCERALRDVGALRRALELPQPGGIALSVRGEAGERTIDVPVAATKPVYGAWPRTETRRLDGDVGYLRLASMDDDPAFLDGIDAAMQRFRDTRGLVVDVRGNGGGSRDALLRLAPYLLPAGGPPIVGNVAAVLLEDGAAAPANALADRHLYRADWDGWTGPQRRAIAEFLKRFEPSWQPTPGRFSPWHFLVLDRAANPKAFAYEHPVVVLIDRGCFSATDVFAAALQAVPGVTVVGEATSGGSGRARGFALPNSGIRLQLSSMASFRPDGTLFEGHGVVPDVAVATRATDLIGATDAALERALELLR